MASISNRADRSFCLCLEEKRLTKKKLVIPVTSFLVISHAKEGLIRIWDADHAKTMKEAFSFMEKLASRMRDWRKERREEDRVREMRIEYPSLWLNLSGARFGFCPARTSPNSAQLSFSLLDEKEKERGEKALFSLLEERWKTAPIRGGQGKAFFSEKVLDLIREDMPTEDPGKGFFWSARMVDGIIVYQKIQTDGLKPVEGSKRFCNFMEEVVIVPLIPEFSREFLPVSQEDAGSFLCHISEAEELLQPYYEALGEKIRGASFSRWALSERGKTIE